MPNGNSFVVLLKIHVTDEMTPMPAPSSRSFLERVIDLLGIVSLVIAFSWPIAAITSGWRSLWVLLPLGLWAVVVVALEARRKKRLEPTMPLYNYARGRWERPLARSARPRR